MKANKLFLLASFFLSSSLTPIAAQSKKEKKQQTEQAVREAVDAKKVGDNKWTVYINGGRVDMRMDLIDWVKKCEQLGAGEICLNSIDTDGVRGGFDLPMLKAVCSAVKIPVIASGESL